MKRIILTICIVLSLTACGLLPEKRSAAENATEQSAAAEAEAAPETPENAPEEDKAGQDAAEAPADAGQVAVESSAEPDGSAAEVADAGIPGGTEEAAPEPEEAESPDARDPVLVEPEAVTAEDGGFAAEEDPAASGEYDTGIVICLDPGHYAGVNAAQGVETYGYVEGDFTLPLALRLRDILWEEYRIRTVLTRETGTITIDGYTDWDLDQGNLDLRGAFAAENDCGLFISLHTNANQENANGCDTFLQPRSLDKPVILVNALVCSSEQLVGLCNEIGTRLASASYAAGISSIVGFEEARAGEIPEWTDEYNDSTGVRGTVLKRTREDGSEYYGVLRGSQESGVPGIIIEHGYHTVPEMRRAAMEGDLIEAWAWADARGIAAGLGVTGDTVKDAA